VLDAEDALLSQVPFEKRVQELERLWLWLKSFDDLRAKIIYFRGHQRGARKDQVGPQRACLKMKVGMINVFALTNICKY